MVAAEPTTLPQRLLATGIVLAALYFGRELLMPLALAVLLGFVLTPLVDRLRRWGVPRVGAVALVVLATIGGLVGTGVFVAGQLRELTRELPTYQENIEKKFDALRERLRGPGIFDNASKVVTVVEKQIDETQAALDREKEAELARARAAKPKPQRVEVVKAQPTGRERLSELFDTLLPPLAMVATVLIYLVLVLLDPGDLRDRLLRLIGGSLHRNTEALNDAGTRVTRYLTMQLIVNVTYAVPMALGLWFIGVPGALLWGVVSAVLRFVPYVGALVGAVMPLLLAFAVDPGWSLVLWTVGLIAVLELVSNNIIEPWLYGSSTGMSTMSLIVAATFWTAIWGPIGLALSTPITVCLLVIGKHLPGLKFLDVLLGAEPALDAPTRLYQRLLAGNKDDALELAVDAVQAGSPRAFYDEIALPVLQRASSDHTDVSTAEHRLRVTAGMGQVIEELRRLHSAERDTSALDCLCIGGRWGVDTLGATMAAHALSLDGVATDVEPAANLTADFMARLDPRGARAICLVYFAPEPHKHAAVFTRRIKRRWPNQKVVIAWFAEAADDVRALEQFTGADAVVRSVDELVTLVAVVRKLEGDLPYLPAAVSAADLERVRALRESGALDTSVRTVFDNAAKRAADIFDVPMALVSLVDDEWQITHGDSTQAPRDAGAPERGAPRAQSLCGHVVADEGTLVVPDVSRDPRFAANPVLRERGIRFYAGAPLRDTEGHVLGTLCLLDTQPRTISARDAMLLERLAGEVMGALVERQGQLASAPNAR